MDIIHSEIQLLPETFDADGATFTRNWADRVLPTVLWDGVATDGSPVCGLILIYHKSFPTLGIDVRTELGAKRAITKIRKQAAALMSGTTK